MSKPIPYKKYVLNLENHRFSHTNQLSLVDALLKRNISLPLSIKTQNTVVKSVGFNDTTRGMNTTGCIRVPSAKISKFKSNDYILYTSYTIVNQAYVMNNCFLQ